jgi:iron(III) transport system substrate-binding protein
VRASRARSPSSPCRPSRSPAVPVARAADTLNAYSIWPENWARPMFEEFEKATGIKVNFVRFSSGEALPRVIAEKNNPRVDVLFGGPVETFAAGITEGVFEPYKSPSFAKLPARMKQPTASGRRSPTIRSCS